MKNILTSVVAATLLTGLTMSSISASTLAIGGNLGADTNTSANYKVWTDLETGTDVNMTLIPLANYQGASFTLKIENAGLDYNKKQLLCVGDTKVGSIQEPGGLVNGHITTEPRFSFIDDDAISSLIEKDSNISFRTADEDNCSKSEAVSIVGLAGNNCQTITAQIISGTSTQGENIDSLKTDVLKIGQTAQAVKISCTVPVCVVSGTNFVKSSAPAGINLSLNDSSRISEVTNKDAADINCPDCTDNPINCTTYIYVTNNANDINVSEMKLTANFIDSTGALANSAFTPSVAIDDNISYSLGKDMIFEDLALINNVTKEIKISLTADGESEIPTGAIAAHISFEDNNSKVLATTFDQNITKILTAPSTRFTVPYMYNASTVSNFVKISSLVDNSSDVELSATITDNYGNICSDVALRSVPGNGGSTYVWANGTDDPDRNYQPLIPEGECSNLTGNQYSVLFTSSASVNVVSYMRTSAGERYIDVF